jgi:hypothetical protein
MRSKIRHLILTLAILAALPAAADAACTSSTPSSASYADSLGDGDAGLAPEIVSVVASTNAACGVAVQGVIAGAAAPGDLIEGDAVGIYLDTDGNPATGSPLWEGADRVAIVVGEAGPDLGPGLGVWDGADFSFVGTPTLAPIGAGGFAATLDQLGMAAPAALGIRVGAIWEGVYDIYGDFAPEVFDPSFRFPVAFSTVAPSPPAPPTTTPPISSPTGCTVPNVKRLRAAKARRRMRAAGCRFRVVRVRSRVRAGRVLSTRPKAGRHTKKRVVIRVSRGRARLAAAPANPFAAIERELSRQVSTGIGD